MVASLTRDCGGPVRSITSSAIYHGSAVGTLLKRADLDGRGELQGFNIVRHRFSFWDKVLRPQNSSQLHRVPRHSKRSSSRFLKILPGAGSRSETAHSSKVGTFGAGVDRRLRHLCHLRHARAVCIDSHRVAPSPVAWTVTKAVPFCVMPM